MNSISRCKDFDEAAFVRTHSDDQRITSIRLNPFKPFVPEFETASRVPWCEAGIYLSTRTSFTFDPLFHAGCYYVQEAGSMFIEQALKQAVDLRRDLAVLDLCAAPGGKSTLINSLISANSFLISNEVIGNRADILSQNLSKWGTCNAAVTSSDPQIFAGLAPVFDVIVADVPCSGSGLFRKQPDAINEWTPELVNLCSARQKRILGEALNCLKQDGILVYSTCSYSSEENEEVVKWLVNEFGMELISLEVPADWGISDTGLGYRFYPYRTKSEGFFCAVLRKTNEGENTSSRHASKSRLEKPTAKELAVTDPFLTTKPGQRIFRFKNELRLTTENLASFYERFGAELYFKKLGTVIGEAIRDELIPDHELATSTDLSPNVKSIELSKADAISFLKKESPKISAEKAIYLATYKNYGLGWMKVLGNRVNNYLPKHFRILKDEEI